MGEGKGQAADGTRRGLSEGSAATRFGGSGRAGKPVKEVKPGKEGKAAPTGKVPQVLLDMRAVYQQDAERDKSEGQRNCRKLLDDSPREFLAQLGRLEQAHRALSAKSGSGDGGGGPKDEGEERALELIDRILGECEDGKPA